MTDKSSSHSEYSSISPLHSTTLLQKIAHHAVQLLNLQDCSIALLNEEQAGLVLLASSRDEIPAGPISVSANLLARVAEKRKPVILTNARRNALMQPLAEHATCALAFLPLLDQGQMAGLLLASSATEFTSEQVQLLSLLAEQAALTLLNAHQAALMRDADRMKAHFLSLITHELRSPLNAINGYLDLALEGLAGELNERQREFLQRARAGSEHLYALIEDLLLASRSDAGQLRLTRELVTLRNLVHDVLEELELTARDAEVSLETEIPADLPVLTLDAVRVQHVLRNLLVNALHSTPTGGHITISAHYEAEQKLVEIRVKDTGCGIDPHYHERIFERFFQLPRPTGGRASGQGLGLAIVKLIVELHGGRVRVESAPNEGSTFIFTLKGSENPISPRLEMVMEE